MSQFCSDMYTEMPNLKANFLTPLTKGVNPKRPPWYTLPKSKNLSKSKPNEPKEERRHKEAKRSGPLANWKGENDQLTSIHPDSWKTKKRSKSNAGFQSSISLSRKKGPRKSGKRESRHLNCSYKQQV